MIEPKVILRMYDRAKLFWGIVDEGRTLDPDYGRDGAALAAVHRQDDGAELDMTHDNELPTIAARLEAANQAKKMADEMADNCKARILHRIGSAAKVIRRRRDVGQDHPSQGPPGAGVELSALSVRMSRGNGEMMP